MGVRYLYFCFFYGPGSGLLDLSPDTRDRELVTKPQNETPYELLTGRQPIISYLRPFGYHVTILNTIDQLGKFDGKYDSRFLVGYSLNSKAFREELEKLKRQEKEANDAVRKETTHETQEVNTNSTNLLNAVSAPVSVVGNSRALNDNEPSYPDDPSMPHLEDIYASLSARIFTDSSYDAEGVVTDFNNLETTVNVSPTSTTRIHTIHPKTQILRDPLSAVQTRSKVHKNSKAHALVWILVNLPFRKKAIGTKWVYRNKKDERGVVVRNKACLVAQGHRKEKGIDYDEVFDPVARIQAIRIFLAFASYMGFIVYQMDVKSAFLYGTIDEEVYVTQPPRFVDPKFPNKVYKVMKALYGLHQAPKAWYATLSTFLEKSRYRRGAIDKTLFIKQDKKDIMLVQVYVVDIIFGSTKKSWCDEFEELIKNSVKTASTLIETQKPLVKDEEAADVYILGYSQDSHLQAVKRIFRYLKGQPKLGLWYPKVSSFELEAYLDSDYAGANLDRKSTTRAALVKGRLLEVTTAKQRLLLPSIEKPAESEGFEQILDFLNGSSVRYALTASPTIHTSCIKQFWSTAKVKTVNDEVRVQALIDEKRGTIKESSIRRTLKLADEEVNHQLGDMSHHQDIYDNPSLSKKVFANMKRVGVGFSGVITPLFKNILVLTAKEVGQGQDDVSIPAEPFTFKPYKKHKSKKQQPIAPKVPSPEPSPEHQLPLPSNDPIPNADKDRLKLQELMNLCTRLSNKVMDLESEVIDIKFSFTDKIEKLEDRVHKLEEENKILKEKSFKSANINTAAPVEDKEESFKQGRMIADMDEDS
nr:retrovirus-related Pol polyprotein from transposon TNT 1-94 [Tanacetum cinerariifolium]